MASLILMWIVIPAADLMEVTTNAPQAATLLHGNVLLECYFGNGEAVGAADVSVKWTVRSGTGGRDVYAFDGMAEKRHRDGTSLDLLLLEKGNASLYLMDVALQDEGSYTCTVLIAPDFGSSTLLLKVAVQPTVALVPENPRLHHGESETFFCDVGQFYPPDFEILWLVKTQGKERRLTSNICTGIPAPDGNGTFGVSSQISVTFREGDGGAEYICEVRHESLRDPQRRNSTVFLAAAQSIQTGSGFIAGVVIGSVLMTAIASVLTVILYQKNLAKATPSMSPLILPEPVPANENMTAICNIHGFRPKAIEVRWFLAKTEGDPASNGSLQDPLLFEEITQLAVHPVTKHGSLFNTTSQLSYTPSLRDDGVTLVCEVKHKSFPGKRRREKKLNVTARPKKAYITSSPQDPRLGETLKLSCIVEKFYPRQISLTWMKNGQLVTDATLFGPFPSENDYFTVWSEVERLLTEDHDGVTYTCQINHDSIGKIEELSYEINLKGTPPIVRWITTDPPNPTEGQELRLRCEISDFSPKDITVDWFQNNTELHAGICNSPCVAIAKGVHLMWSMLNITPQRADDGSVFTCRVRHVALKNCEERSYTLRLTG